MLDKPPTNIGVLSYGKESWWRCKRRWIKVLIAIAIVTVVVAIGNYILQPHYTPYLAQWNHLKMQARYSKLALPPKTVIYTEDPKRIEVLQANPDYQVNTYRAVYGLDVNEAPEGWERRMKLLDSFQGMEFRGTIANVMTVDTFGAIRTSRHGYKWLVLMPQAGVFPLRDGRRAVTVSHSSFQEVGWKPGSRGSWVTAMTPRITLTPENRLTIFAPQSDPADTALIFIPYELDGKSGTIVAEIRDDGRIGMKVDSGPAVMEPWDAK